MPDIDVPPDPVKDTVWSGAELVTVTTPAVADTDMPVPAVKLVFFQ